MNQTMPRIVPIALYIGSILLLLGGKIALIWPVSNVLMTQSASRNEAVLMTDQKISTVRTRATVTSVDFHPNRTEEKISLNNWGDTGVYGTIVTEYIHYTIAMDN